MFVDLSLIFSQFWPILVNFSLVFSQFESILVSFNQVTQDRNAGIFTDSKVGKNSTQALGVAAIWDHGIDRNSLKSPELRH